MLTVLFKEYGQTACFLGLLCVEPVEFLFSQTESAKLLAKRNQVDVENVQSARCAELVGTWSTAIEILRCLLRAGSYCFSRNWQALPPIEVLNGGDLSSYGHDLRPVFTEFKE